MNRSTLIATLLACLFLLNMQAQVGGFRFAQLTDLHLSPVNEQPTEDLIRSVAQLNATRGIDFVLVTGDLTEEGDSASLALAKRCLDRLRVPYYTVLGNHETKWSASGVTAFAQIFGPERIDFTHGGIRFLGFNSGPLMRMAYGHVAPQDIDWLVDRLRSAPAGQPVIIVTHYPLQAGDVDNWQEVTDALTPFNIRLYIGGHYHANRSLRYDGVPGILMRSNLRDDDQLPGYGLYDVTADSIKVSTQRIGEAARQWAAFSLTDNYRRADDRTDKDADSADKDADRANRYADYSVNEAYKQVGERWRVRTRVGIYSSPVVEGDRVFVGDDAGRLTAYTLSSGRRLWSFAAEARIVGTPAVAKGIVVFGSADGHIYALRAADGTQLWRLRAGGPVLGAVTIADGIAYVGASDHTFRAVRTADGQVIWTYKDVRGYVETKPLVTRNLVVFGAWDNTLYALNRGDGRELWRWTGGLTRMHYSPAAVWPVAAKGKVFIADPQRALTAIRAADGHTVWRTFASQVRESIGLSADGLRLYGKTMNDSIVCYSTEGDAPRQLWATNVGFGYEHAPSMPLECDGVLFGSTVTGLIFALDAPTGRLLWKHRVGNSMVNTLLPLNRREVLYTTTAGDLGRLRVK